MKAFITGITGQDGYYLAKYLLELGYEVHGTQRRTSTFNTSRIDGLISEYSKQGKLKLYYSDLLDPSSLNNLVKGISPDEIYNLAAQSHVAVSFKNPLFTTQTSTIGPLTLLEAVKNSNKPIILTINWFSGISVTDDVIRVLCALDGLWMSHMGSSPLHRSSPVPHNCTTYIER